MSENQDPSQQAARGIRGVFSIQEVRKVGTGTTTRKTIQKTYWQCIEQEGDEIEIQPLNINYVPSGPKKKIPKEDFLKHFAPEPEFYISKVFPKLKELNKTLARADRFRENKEYYSAEMEYGNALKVDEANVRANFGLGITYLERGENSKAEDILTRLVNLDDAFEPQHKHLFNEFGINLRKNGLHDQAIRYYERALQLASSDENLYYNIARAYLERGLPDKALERLLKGLSINPGQDILMQFLTWMSENGHVAEQHRAVVAKILAGKRAATVRIGGNEAGPGALPGVPPVHDPWGGR